MNIVVLVKQVPAISDIEIAKDNNLVRVGAPSMLNPVDKHAIEAAVAVKDAIGGTVTILTMGNALAGEMMRDGIAIGADKGVLVSDERMAGSDTLATGLVLAKAIEKLGGADLVFTGKRSTDGDTGQIPPAIAQRLGMALISYANSVSVDGTTVTATALKRYRLSSRLSSRLRKRATRRVLRKSAARWLPRKPSSMSGKWKTWASMQQVSGNLVRRRKSRNSSHRNRIRSAS